MPDRTSATAPASVAPRHPLFVRVTHWLTVLAFAGLLVSGAEVVLSHPRFYWGEVGNVNTTPLFSLPVPSSRRMVPTGYGFVLPDQNGWSRYLHVQAAWLVLFVGVVYVVRGAMRRHFRQFVPEPGERSPAALAAQLVAHLRLRREALGDAMSYNSLQRLAYLVVVFVLFPLVIWTGLAQAPAFTAVVPSSVTLLGGRQSARTLHFAVTIALVAFTLAHLVMLVVAGFGPRVRAMITGTTEEAT